MDELGHLVSGEAPPEVLRDKRYPPAVPWCPQPKRRLVLLRFGPFGRSAAHEFPEGLDWLNVSSPLTLSDLRGRIVLLDFNLGTTRAPEVVAAMRATPALHYVPIVIFSDSCAAEDMQASYESGANGYVCKPVDFAEFQESVRVLARYWLQLNRLPPQKGGTCIH